MIVLTGLVLTLTQELAPAPRIPRDYVWNRAGVSEADFRADVDACRAAFDAENPHAGASGTLTERSGVHNDLNRYSSGDRSPNARAVDAWDDCFEARGYRITYISGRDERRLFGRSISDEDRTARLFEVATEERRTYPHPRYR